MVLADGMADYPINELGNKTPLQAANTPNMDLLSRTSLIGTVRTVPEGFPPGSDVANLSVMGYDPRRYYTGRSPLEAVSMGVELGDDDLALRCNLVSLSDEPEYVDKTMLDYSAEEIPSEQSALLMATVQKELGNDDFSFHAGISYRHLMVWKDGKGKDLDLTPPHDISGQKISGHLPRGQDGQVLLAIMRASEKLLNSHPLNQSRRKQGFKAANSLWFWGEGNKPLLPSFLSRYGLHGSVVAAVDLVKGLGISAGMTPVAVPGATGGVHTNFAGKARAALHELKRGQDFVYVHIESPDEAGHQGSLESKIWSIEQVDREVIGTVLRELDDFNDIRIMLLPDHPTPLATRTHSPEPVPFMIFDKRRPHNNHLAYDEASARDGIYIEEGHLLMDLFIKGTF